jgi:hypothetical protein
VPDGQVSTYYWVARAKDTNDNWSGDSNEVTCVFDLSPLMAIADLNAVFNKVSQTVDFTWTQTDTARVTSWKLYKADVTGGPYSEIANIPWDGTSATVSASIPADTLAPGNDYYFVVVSFGADGLFSPNSNEVKIDRKPPTKVINLKITLQ